VRNQLFNKRIPTLFGIGIIMMGILLTNTAIKNQTSFSSKASSSEEPKNIKITNVSDNSFTVTFQTDVPTISSIKYGQNEKLEKSEIEKIDKEKGTLISKKIHSISINNLLPITKYYFSITSGSNTFLNNDVSFETITGSEIPSTSIEDKVLTGKIVSPNGDTLSEGIVYLNTNNSQLLSTVFADDGKFNFSLKEIRTSDLASYLDLNSNSPIRIFATDGNLTSVVLVSLNQNDSIPTIILSNNYDFTQEIHSIASESAELARFPSIAISKNNLKLEIISPKDNQTFTNPKPQFRGTSLPNENIEITIQSNEEIKAQITADKNGNWTYKPFESLSPGIHTITIKTRDSLGILRTISKMFTIYTNEILTSIPTRIPTPTRAISPTVMPMPTSELTPTTVLSMSSTASVLAASTNELEPTGSSQAILIFGGIIAVLAGITLLFFTHKTS
jgi:hypothetical protein